MILVFTGAGASSAVSQDKYPTTIKYFDKIEAPIKNNPLFKSAQDDISFNNEPLDIENILFRLGKLQEQFNQKNLISEYKNLYETVLKNVKIEPNLSDLIESINSKVFSYYGQPPEESEIKNNWLKLLDILEKSKQKYEIVTTNYDTNIETSFDYYKENNDLSLSDGFKRIKGQGEILDLSLWSKFDKDSKNGLITKLHGSVNWYGNRNHIHRSIPMYQGKNEHPIIYPGFKGNPNQEKKLSNNFHSYFEQMLPHVKHAIFIGFAFRDEYINSLLAKINQNAKITNIGFGEEPKGIPINLKKNRIPNNYIYLKQGFGVDSLNEFEKRLNE